jgi:hypothetical protein
LFHLSKHPYYSTKSRTAVKYIVTVMGPTAVRQRKNIVSVSLPLFSRPGRPKQHLDPNLAVAPLHAATS